MKKATAKRFAEHPRELFLVAGIFLFLLSLPFALRFRRIQDIVASITPRPSRAPRRRMDAERITYLCERSMDRLARFGYRRTCLRRCLVIYRFLRGAGVPVIVNFGALREGETLSGHSWLTLDGALYHEAQEKVDQFVHFFSLPASEAGGAPGAAPDAGKPEDLGQACFD